MKKDNFRALQYAAIVPHPPALIPEIGGDEQKLLAATRKAVGRVFEKIKKIDFDTLVIISPHSLIGQESVPVLNSPRFTGNLGAFGGANINFNYKGDAKLAAGIVGVAEHYGIAVQESDKTNLDYGTLVPLYFYNQKKIASRILPLGIAYSSRLALFTFGGILTEAAQAAGRKIVVLASGDLSHRLKKDAPQGYSEVAKEFDNKIVTAVKKMKPKEILELSHNLAEEAGECGIRPISIMLGAINGLKIKTSVLSYEAPFGVGYLVAEMEVLKK